jgi:superfamily I DNA/RNA helicase
VRIMTIHKSKGLEFDTVVLLAVEEQAFWGKTADERSAFFVGISRAKRRLKLTWAAQRAVPSGKPWRWATVRTPQKEFIGYCDGLL